MQIAALTLDDVDGQCETKLGGGGIKFKLYVVHLETDLQQDHEVKLRDASGPSADASRLIRNDISGCQGVFKEV